MVDGFRFKVFRRGEDVGGVDATVEFGFGGTGYEGDFVAVVGARGFDELFLDFDAADGTEREGVLDAPGKIAAAGTDVHDGTSSAFRVRHGFSFQQKFDHRTRGGATRVQDLRSHVVVVFVDVLYEAFVVSRVFHDAFLIVVVTRVVVVVVVVVVRVALEVVLSVAATSTGRDENPRDFEKSFTLKTTEISKRGITEKKTKTKNNNAHRWLARARKTPWISVSSAAPVGRHRGRRVFLHRKPTTFFILHTDG